MMVEGAGNSCVAEAEIKTAHFRYAVKRWGNPKGLKILALHGWLDNAATFDHLAPLLPEVELVALDFPGHGYSAHKPRGVKYHYLDYITDVVNVADALKWERFVLMGHSLGAGIASIASAAIPDRVEKLILLEGLGAMSRDPKEAPQHLAKSLAQMKILTQKFPPVYRLIEDMISARVNVGDMKRSSVEVLVKRGAVELENGIAWRSDPRLKVTSPSYLTDEQVLAYLGAIQAPVLLVLAENGIFSDKEYLKRRCDMIKLLKQVTIKGSHHVHLDDPVPVAQSLRSFLNLAG
jgi:pimeloyl-ACP methyl ester carboxylesterase